MNNGKLATFPIAHFPLLTDHLPMIVIGSANFEYHGGACIPCRATRP
jgi:hypothetical protein